MNGYNIGILGMGKMGQAMFASIVKTGNFTLPIFRNQQDILLQKVDIVILTVPYSSIPDIAHFYGEELAKKSLLLDVSNPRLDRDGDVAMAAQAQGAGLYLSSLIPGARIVRGFNAVRADKLAEFGKRGKTVPLAGDDGHALYLACELAKTIGFKPVVVGNLKAAGKLLPYGTGLDGDFTETELLEFVRNMK